jgi:hypothetical protein
VSTKLSMSETMGANRQRDMIAIYGLRLTTAIWNWYRSTQMPTERSLPFTFIQVACAAELIVSPKVLKAWD